MGEGPGAGPLPGSSGLDMSRVRAAGAGGLSLTGQEGLTRPTVGQTVLSRLLLQGHSLRRPPGGGRAQQDSQCNSILKINPIKQTWLLTVTIRSVIIVIPKQINDAILPSGGRKNIVEQWFPNNGVK